MKPALVLDCSVALAWCFLDESEEYPLDVLRVLESSSALVPAIWPLEMLNTLLVGQRRERLDETTANAFVETVGGLPLQIEDPPGRERWERLLSLGRRFQLSAYDAAYLELAQRARLPLATLDRSLLAAAAALGVARFAPARS